MSRGVVEDWDTMEAVWRHAFLALDVEPHAVCMTELPMNPKAARERVTRLMFDTFRVELFILISAPLAALYSSGRSTGITVSCGHEVTHFVPIYESYVMPHAILYGDYGGKDVQDLLFKLGVAYDEAQCHQIILKKSYVAPNYEEEMQNFVRLPPSSTGGLGSSLTTELFRCQEVWFDANLRPYGDKDVLCAPALCWESIKRCDVDIRNDLVGNVLLAGGPTLARGFPERFKSELTKLAPDTMRVKVIAPQERAMSAWIGGSIIASLSTFAARWISRQEYDELGVAAAVQRKIISAF